MLDEFEVELNLKHIIHCLLCNKTIMEKWSLIFVTESGHNEVWTPVFSFIFLYQVGFKFKNQQVYINNILKKKNND